MGVFDRICIDGIWVGYTKAWIIPGTEDLMPYIPVKGHVKKWLVTLIFYPAVGALVCWRWFCKRKKTGAASRMAADFGLLLYGKFARRTPSVTMPS